MQAPVSALTVSVKRADFRAMLQLVRTLEQLSAAPAYRQLVAPLVPPQAVFDPGHASLMMCYDFHLSEDGPKLIEVNTNAGGSSYAWLAEQQSAARPASVERLPQRYLDSLQAEWQGFCRGGGELKTLAIVDEQPQQQALYNEMQYIAQQLEQAGYRVIIADPAELEISADGVVCSGEKIDLIYNRHCDFYLEEDTLAELRQAWLERLVCLSPNPHMYGLLADKRRMILWSDADQLAHLPLSAAQQALLLQIVPHSRLLADCDTETVWQERKQLIFKPVDRFGARGVLTGKSLSKKRFAEQDPQTTLVQQLVPPSQIVDDQQRSYKVDLRLYAYRNRCLGLTARAYQGQVTNMRTEGGGFCRVRVV